jgi:hypothetical protein
MAITKQTVSLADNITERGQIHVKTITRVLEDGKLLSESVHRKVLNPGDSLTGEAAQVAAVAAALWTPEVIAAWHQGTGAGPFDWRPGAVDDLNAFRAGAISVLTGMQVDYANKGQTANATACMTAKEALRTIEATPELVAIYDAWPDTTREQYKAAVMARWLQIASAAPLQVKLDFNGYGGNSL